MAKIIVYHGGGDFYCGGDFENTPKVRRMCKRFAKVRGQVGYLSGYRYNDGGKDAVLCFFSARPSSEEIMRRRRFGLKAATWHSL